MERAVLDAGRMTPRNETERDLVDLLVGRGFEDRARAELALRATLAVLAQRLTHDEALRLAHALPGELSDATSDVDPQPDLGTAELVERVRERCGVTAGRAREQLQIICETLGAHLSDEDRRAITRGLPPEIAADFEPLARESGAVHEVDQSATRSAPAADDSTLAGGRPGSRHPLSEARPDGAHAESVARARDPHGATKLSSATGLTQEREGETLATARRGT